MVNAGLDTEGLLALVDARALVRRGKEIRKKVGVSRVEVAQVLGVSTMSLSYWESGKHQPRGDTALRYADLLREFERHT